MSPGGGVVESAHAVRRLQEREITKTTAALASPPPRTVDVRVAGQPLVGIRFHLDARMGELVEVLDAIASERAVLLERRALVRDRLRRNEEARRELLGSLPRQSLLAVRRCLREGVETSAELGRIEEQVQGLARIHTSLIRECRTLRELSGELAGVTVGPEIELNGRARRYSQATRHVLGLVDEERDAVANALVQGPLQLLAEAVLDIEVAMHHRPEEQSAARERAARCTVATGDAQRGFDRLLQRWRPLPAGGTLVDALQALLADLDGRPAARLRVIGAERTLPAPVSLLLYRVAEEAVDNAMRHSGAASVEVLLSYRLDRVALLVRDDGDGFDVVATEARLGRSRGLGILAMRSRAAVDGATADIRSVIGAGTEVRCTVPLPPAP